MEQSDPFEGMAMPLIDPSDVSMVGWQAGTLDDGSGNCAIQATCSNCGEQHSIIFPPGASLIHVPGEGLVAKDLNWQGRFVAPPPPREPSADERGKVP